MLLLFVTVWVVIIDVVSFHAFTNLVLCSNTIG